MSGTYALIASRFKGDGWIAPAIARIGSPRAITWAFEVLGVKGVPYLVKLYDCSPPLLAIAEDARRDRTGRRGAISGPSSPITALREE